MVKAFVRRARGSLLVQNAAWLFAGQGLSFVVQGFYFIVLARLLGTTQYGLLAGAFALAGIVGQYSTLGSGIVFLRYVSADHSQFNLYWGNILLSVLVLGSLLVATLSLCGRWLVGPETVPLLLPVAMAECLFQQLGTCSGQVFQTFEQMKFSAGLTLLSSVSRCLLAVTVLIILGKASAWQWALASLAVSCMAACIAVSIVTRRFGWPTFSPSLFIRRAAEGFIFAISGSTTVVYNDVDKVVLAHYGMDRTNGIYSMAYRVVNIGAMPIQSIVGAALPRFFREGVRGIAKTVPMARALLRRTAGLGLLVSLGMFVCAPIIPFMAGTSFAESVNALRWLCLIPFFRCFHLSAGDAIAGAGHQKFRLVSQSIAAAGNLAMNLYLVPRYSWHGAAWASLVTDGALGAMNWLALLWLAKQDTPVLHAMG